MQANRLDDIGIVLVLRREQRERPGSLGANAPLKDGYYIARLSATAFTGELAPHEVRGGPFAHIDEARSAMEQLKSGRTGV